MKLAMDEFRTLTGLMGWTVRCAVRYSDDSAPLRTMITLPKERTCVEACTNSSFASPFVSTSRRLTVRSCCFWVVPVSGIKTGKS